MNVEWFWSSSVLILLLMLIRFVFRKKIPPCMRYSLWLVVAIRLLLPFSVSETAVSVLNFLPGREMVQAAQGNIQLKDLGTFNIQSKTFASSEGSMPTEAEYGKNSEADFFVPEETRQGGDYIIGTDIMNAELPAARGNERSGRPDGSHFDDYEQYVLYHWITCAWLLGSGMCGLILLAVNLNYGRRLKRSRSRIADIRLPRQSMIPVYTAPIVQTPFLFGLFCPAVYVTEEVLGDAKLFDFVLCHENTHYIHRDHGWAFVRMLCFCLHWYNPLVWIAVYLSKQDGELACDEGVVKRLEDRQRIDYGNALLELSRMGNPGIGGWQLSTTMRGSKLRLKERLQMIVSAPKKARGMQAALYLLVGVLFVSVFTGKKEGDRSLASEPSKTADTAVRQEEQVPAEPSAESDSTGRLSTKPMPEPYQGASRILLGEKEYQLLYEGYALEDGLYNVEAIKLADSENADSYLDTIFTAEVSGAYWQKQGTDPLPVRSTASDGNLLITDLNFDGWNDLCFQGWDTGNADIPYYCMLWNPQRQEFEWNTMLYNVETDAEKQWLFSEKTEGERHVVIYYRYDAEDKLHMLRYVERNQSKDAVFEQLDLTYVEEGSVYTLPAVEGEGHLPVTMIEMARQSLTELYQWTGEKIDTACFQVSDMGGVTFSVSEADMNHSRVFFTRYFGVDTEYNLSGYDKSISSIDVASGRSVWYSPVLFRVQPGNLDDMTDEEVVIWYFERVPTAGNSKVKTIEQRYEDMWTVQAEDGNWFEVIYDAKLREAMDVTGPYPDYPIH